MDYEPTRDFHPTGLMWLIMALGFCFIVIPGAVIVLASAYKFTLWLLAVLGLA